MRHEKKLVHRSRARRPRTDASIEVEALEGRALLSVYGPYGPMPTPMPPTMAGTGPRAVGGVVTKAPHFYQVYTGPKWSELNAVRASAELSQNGNFTFTGTSAGRINKLPATFVWGIDRSGNLSAGPFTDRPNIKFDAVVVVSLETSLTPQASVVDLSSGVATELPAGSATIHGRTVSVTVPGSLLPSTGLSTSHYRFNFWPEDGGSGSTAVASFAPERTTAQVGTLK
jgi:hypothetical protein